MDDLASGTRTTERRGAPMRRLADAQSILGCGDDADRAGAIAEIDQLERELGRLPKSSGSGASAESSRG